MANESSLSERERQDQEKAEDNRKRQLRLSGVAPEVEVAPKATPKKRSRSRATSKAAPKKRSQAKSQTAPKKRSQAKSQATPKNQSRSRTTPKSS